MQTGITGELVPHLDRAGMLASLERLLKDLEYAQIVGAAVRNRIIEMMDTQILSEYERDQFRAAMKQLTRQRLHRSANDLTVQ